MRKAIVILYNLMLFFTPLVFYAGTSELFEFNKMVLTYLFTTVIVSFWLIRMIVNKKFIFRRTILDIPLLIFFSSQLISTLVSIDIRSSIFGYYSRFNGGLISTVCYILIYFGYVSNVYKEETKRLIKVALISGLIVSIYGILEHFGGSISCLLLVGRMTDDCWVQDVRTRVFATLGQPNWMAAYLIALIPLAWSQVLQTWNNKDKRLRVLWLTISTIFFFAILYTKSRSGLIALGLAGFIFGGITLLNNFKNKTKKEIMNVILPGALIGFSILLGVLLSGTPWTSSIPDLVSKKQVSDLTTKLNSTSEGGTESGDIRKIVWSGAINIWRAYPIFGTGPETFAFTYYMYRTREHNLVSEWDFLYNKAHNEYLNFAANSGSLGLASYLVLIGFSIYMMVSLYKKSKKEGQNNYLILGLLSGYGSILVTNFFGFSVVITQLMLFLIPAMAFALLQNDSSDDKNTSLNAGQKIGNTLIIIFGLFVIWNICKYWTADTFYAQAKAEIETGRIQDSVIHLDKAIKNSPNEPLYHDKLAQIYAAVAKASISEKDTTSAGQLEKLAMSEADRAYLLSPKNFIVLQDRVNIYSDLSSVNPNNIMESIKILEYLTTYAPNYAKIYYKLGVAYQIIDQKERAIENIKKAIELKPNYTEAIDQLNRLNN